MFRNKSSPIGDDPKDEGLDVARMKDLILDDIRPDQLARLSSSNEFWEMKPLVPTGIFQSFSQTAVPLQPDKLFEDILSNISASSKLR